MVLEKVVCNSQNPFVKRSQIFDSVLIVNECLDSRLRSSLLGGWVSWVWRKITITCIECLDSRLKSCFLGGLCKLGLEKDYDHMHWSFLIYKLRRLPSSKSNRLQVRFRESTSPLNKKGVWLPTMTSLDSAKVGILCIGYNIFLYVKIMWV